MGSPAAKSGPLPFVVVWFIATLTLGPGSSLTQTVCARPLGTAGRKRVMAAIRQLGISAPMASQHQLRDHRRRCQWESLSRTLVDSGWRARTRIIRASHAKRGVWRGRRCGMVRLAATEAGHLRSKRRQTSRGVCRECFQPAGCLLCDSGDDEMVVERLRRGSADSRDSHQLFGPGMALSVNG